jgi:hypothetical protein
MKWVDAPTGAASPIEWAGAPASSGESIMNKLPTTSIAFSTIVIIVSLFTSGCIADADTAECGSLARGSDAALADEGVDPCGNEDQEGDDEGDADSVEENESSNWPELTTTGLCTTPSCNKP